MKKKSNDAPRARARTLKNKTASPLQDTELDNNTIDDNRRKYTFYINTELMQDFKILAVRKGLKYSRLVEEALESYLRNQSKT